MTQQTEHMLLQATIKNCSFFSYAQSQFLSDVLAQAQFLRVPKAKLLFVSDDPASRFYIICNGSIKIFRETLDGAQAVVDILVKGDVFGETSIFHDGRYPFSAEVIEPSEVVSMPISLLKTEIETNSKMALLMLEFMARYRRQQDLELEHRTLQSAPQRIGCFLLNLVDQRTSGPITIHLPYDKTLLASKLGMQPETFSRALAKLKDAVGMRVKGATIELDKVEKLIAFSCSSCSHEFPCTDKD